jgi:hypothetical protein
MHKDTTTPPFINIKATKGKKSGTNANKFDPIVTIIDNVFTPGSLSHVKLSQALQMVRQPSYQTKQLIEKVRNGQTKLKINLPAFLFAGEFTYAKNEGITKAAGLLQIEFDKIHDPTEKDYFFKILTSDPHILAVFTSPSGAGLKVLIRINETTSPHEYKRLFWGFKDYLIQTYITLKDGENCKYFDTGISDISRKCFQSYDPNLFVNYQALIFDKPRHQEPEPDKIQKTPQAPGTQAQGQTRGIENEAHLKNIIQKIILNTRDGDKHNVLRDASFMIGGYVAGENLDTQKWIDILKNLQAQRGEASPETSYNTILSGIEKGQSQPLFFTQASTPGTQAQASENLTNLTPINNAQAPPPPPPPPPQEIPEILQLIQPLKIDPTQEIAPPTVILEQITENKSAPIASMGNFSVITGKAKSKKSFLVGALTSCIANGNFWGNLKGNLPENKQNILFIDTEQGRYHVQNAFKRILKHAKLQNHTRLHFYNFRSLNPNYRLQGVEYLIKNTPGIGFVVIDGIKDLITTINDETEANMIANKLLQWSEVYDLHILTVLHQNKADSNARGHVGTELINKAETVFSVTKDNENEWLSIVEATQCRNIEPDKFTFEIVNGTPEFNFDIQTPERKPDHLDPDKLIIMIRDVFARNENYVYSNLVMQTKIAFEDHFKLRYGDNKIKEIITRLKNKGVLKNENKIWFLDKQNSGLSEF